MYQARLYVLSLKPLLRVASVLAAAPFVLLAWAEVCLLLQWLVRFDLVLRLDSEWPPVFSSSPTATLYYTVLYSIVLDRAIIQYTSI